MKDNKLIREFMYKGDFEHPKVEGSLPFGDYHNSWDWLMPAVSKIRSLVFEDEDYKMKGSLGNSIACVDLYVSIFKSFRSCDVKVSYKAVVEFIKWNNKQENQ